MTPQNLPTIESDALRANLLETAVDKVEINPSYQVLLDIVGGYRGIHNNLEELLYEISHPFRNWNLILPKLRTFVLKNQGHYRRDSRGPEAFTVFTEIFFQAVEESSKNEALLSQAVESFLAYLDSLVISLDPPGLKAYEKALAKAFSRLTALDDRLMMHIVQGHHPIKKIAGHLLKLSGETEGAACDLRPVAGLLKRILALNYSYWLSEEDPLPWFYQECGEMCAGWEAGKLFNAISHQQIQVHAATLEEIDIGRKKGQRDALGRLLALPAHLDIVRAYKGVPPKLLSGETASVKGEADRFAENRKLLFLFRIMDTPGLFLIHEETLRE
ncbi:MAG: phosphoenolpyruvate synthase, partial [Deltaproteobacteria bacterium]